MNLFEVTNGWFGESYTRVYVWCKTKGQAIEMASSAFKEYAMSRPHNKYNELFWSKDRLEAEYLFSDDSLPFASEPSDCTIELPYLIMRETNGR